MVMPVTDFIMEENGKSGTVKLPAEIWQRGGTWTFPYKSTSKISYVILDPDHVLPDVNPDNNSLSGKLVAKGLTAKDVIDAYISAVGGAGKLKDVSDLTVKSDGLFQGVDIKMVAKYKAPDKFNLNIIAPSYNNFVLSNIVINGDSVRLKQFNNPATVSKEENPKIRNRYRIFPELDYDKAGYKVELAPVMQVVDGQLAYLITVTNPEGIRARQYYDPKTSFKIKRITDVAGSVPSLYSNYQSIVTGVKIPYTEKTFVGGVATEFKVTGATVNSGLTNDDFK
jgi:hypothetical protein